MTASRYSYIGGFDGTSNVLAGMLTGIPVKGTQAHSFISCFLGLSDLNTSVIASPAAGQPPVEFVSVVLANLERLGYTNKTNEGELAAMISYAQSFPTSFLALVDTYDTLISGVPNFLAVGWGLFEVGYKPIGIRLDSGDLAYLSVEARSLFLAADVVVGQELFATCTIIASNDINEDVLLSLERAQHEIDVFAIGTNLVTCQSQPALGCVYKLVEINGQARIKLSQEMEKTVIPGRKNLYRLTGTQSKDCPLIDVMQLATDPAPTVGQRLLCRHPFVENKRAHIIPATVTPLLVLQWNGPAGGRTRPVSSIEESKLRVFGQLQKMRPDHIRPLNPTPYKVALEGELYDFMHQLWMNMAPISDLT
ncbi:NAPRT1 [Symbiodinium microadriaticum]|nr:NAPRT1 [Symbiodinium microadriaticum]